MPGSSHLDKTLDTSEICIAGGQTLHLVQGPCLDNSSIMATVLVVSMRFVQLPGCYIPLSMVEFLAGKDAFKEVCLEVLARLMTLTTL